MMIMKKLRDSDRKNGLPLFRATISVLVLRDIRHLTSEFKESRVVRYRSQLHPPDSHNLKTISSIASITTYLYFKWFNKIVLLTPKRWLSATARYVSASAVSIHEQLLHYFPVVDCEETK
jgi:hypothetical protein